MENQFKFRAGRHTSAQSSEVEWYISIPAIKRGDCVETGQMRFKVAPKKTGSRLMQVSGLHGVWAPGAYPKSEADEENARLILMRAQFITLMKFRDDIPPIPNSGPLGDDDEPVSSLPRLRQASMR